MFVKCTGCNNDLPGRVINGVQSLYPIHHSISHEDHKRVQCVGVFSEGVEVQQSPILPRKIIEMSITSIFISNESNVDFVSFVQELSDFVQERQREARDAALDWAAKHMNDNNLIYMNLDDDVKYSPAGTILAGKTSKDLHI